MKYFLMILVLVGGMMITSTATAQCGEEGACEACQPRVGCLQRIATAIRTKCQKGDCCEPACEPAKPACEPVKVVCCKPVCKPVCKKVRVRKLCVKRRRCCG